MRDFDVQGRHVAYVVCGFNLQQFVECIIG